MRETGDDGRSNVLWIYVVKRREENRGAWRDDRSLRSYSGRNEEIIFDA